MKKLLALTLFLIMLLAACAPTVNGVPGAGTETAAAQTPAGGDGTSAETPAEPSSQMPATTPTPIPERTVKAELLVPHNAVPSRHDRPAEEAPEDFYEAYKTYAEKASLTTVNRRDLFNEITPDGSAARAFIDYSGHVYLFIDGEVYDADCSSVHSIAVWDYDDNGVCDLLISGTWGSGMIYLRLALFDASKKEVIRLEPENTRGVYALVQTDAQGVPYLTGDAHIEVDGSGRLWEYALIKLENTDSGIRFVPVEEQPLTLSGQAEGLSADLRYNKVDPEAPDGRSSERHTYTGVTAAKLLEILSGLSENSVKAADPPSAFDSALIFNVSYESSEDARACWLIGKYTLSGAGGVYYLNLTDRNEDGAVVTEYYTLPAEACARLSEITQISVASPDPDAIPEPPEINTEAWARWLGEYGTEDPEYRALQTTTGVYYRPDGATFEDFATSTPWENQGSPKHFAFAVALDTARFDVSFDANDISPYTWHIWYKDADTEDAWKECITKPRSLFGWKDGMHVFRVPTYGCGMTDLHTNGGEPNQYDFIVAIFNDDDDSLVCWFECFPDVTDEYERLLDEALENHYKLGWND